MESSRQLSLFIFQLTQVFIKYILHGQGLDACVFLFPSINFALIDSDCVPVTLFEIRELWFSSTDSSQPVVPSKVAKSKQSSPIATSHKRARSVDTGRDMQQPGPTSKLSRSRSADDLATGAADPPRAPTFTTSANLADEVDYDGSPEPSPRMSRSAMSSSSDSFQLRRVNPQGKKSWLRTTELKCQAVPCMVLLRI